jgi:N-carbamoyl-L-amino-acid hydrolase
MQIEIDKMRLLNELNTLATFTDAEPSSEGTAVTRIVFSTDDLRARAWLKDLAIAEGFAVRDDAVGNIFIRWPGTEPDLPAIATGSHTDAIPHAGMYDGTVGVLGGLEAMRALKRSGLQPRRSIELIMFTSEEPTRFGIGCLGSRLLSGTLYPDRADALQDKDEVPLNAVRTAAGFAGPLSTVLLKPNHYHAWIELHIEQGPLLEREKIPIGIVTSIAAPAGYRFTITGFGGHAGALLMPDRKDALCAAAELILSVERHTLATGAIDTVATVGTCDVHPGAVNSVPSRVVLQLDIRDTDPARREAVMQAIRRDCESYASAARSPSRKSWSTPTLPRNAPPTPSNFSKTFAGSKASPIKKW